MDKSVTAYIKKQVSTYHRNPAYLLQILTQIQLTYQHISTDAIDLLASELDIFAVRIYALIEFYHFIHYRPRGQYDIYISDDIIDHMQGKNALTDYFCQKLHVELNQPNPESGVTIADTACTGMSDQGPAALINGLPVPLLTTQKIDLICEKIKAGIAVSQWPKAWFKVADNIHGKGPLLSTPIIRGDAFKKALLNSPEKLLAQIKQSGLRGCGGAGFNTALKWQSCQLTKDTAHYVVCNADEGEPGTFKDRVLLSRYGELLIEGMILCAFIIGAGKGIIYLRYEYQYLAQKLQTILQKRRTENLLGKSILGSTFDFDIEVVIGAGAYVCGEESALLESLEGKRAIPRIRPPFPATHGYFNKPTVVNNVETFCYAALIAAKGPDLFVRQGIDNAGGCKLLSISGDLKHPGIYEVPLGLPISRILDLCGAHAVQAIQVGGPSGTLIKPDEFNRRLSFDDLNSGGSFMIFNSERDIFDNALNFSHFFMQESCGFCTPCRVGSKLLCDLADKVAGGHGGKLDIKQIKLLNQVMTEMSHCGLGQSAAKPLLQTLEKFPEYIEKRITDQEYQPAFDVEKSIQQAIAIVTLDDD